LLLANSSGAVKYTSSIASMRINRLGTLAIVAAAGFAFLTGCGTISPISTGTFPGNYRVVAYKPSNPSNVRVKVSLQNRMIYVMEGSRPLLITPGTIGIPGKSTPTGGFHVTNKIREKRSGSYGFWVSGSSVVPGTSDRAPGRGFHYVGYPMAYWVEFAPEYGFHAGPVWPVPHSHGCIRLHPNAAPKFFALVNRGTPVSIAQSQAEDRTIGQNVPRPDDYKLPDPAASYMVSNAVFSAPQEPLFAGSR
jgi:L,D-transpeptidase-like protein